MFVVRVFSCCAGVRCALSICVVLIIYCVLCAVCVVECCLFGGVVGVVRVVVVGCWLLYVCC